MNKELVSLLAMAAYQDSLLPYTLRRIQKLKPTGRDSKTQDEQNQVILTAQAKREKRATKRLVNKINTGI